jgi:hypothetical protein
MITLKSVIAFGVIALDEIFASFILCRRSLSKDRAAKRLASWTRFSSTYLVLAPGAAGVGSAAGTGALTVAGSA